MITLNTLVNNDFLFIPAVDEYSEHAEHLDEQWLHVHCSVLRVMITLNILMNNNYLLSLAGYEDSKHPNEQ